MLNGLVFVSVAPPPVEGGTEEVVVVADEESVDPESVLTGAPLTRCIAYPEVTS